MIYNQKILNFTPSTTDCNDPPVKKAKLKSSIKNDFISKKKGLCCKLVITV